MAQPGDSFRLVFTYALVGWASYAVARDEALALLAVGNVRKVTRGARRGSRLVHFHGGAVLAVLAHRAPTYVATLIARPLARPSSLPTVKP